MTRLHRSKSRPAGPVWGLALGGLLTVVAIGLWFYAKTSGQSDEVWAAASVFAGVFSVIYAAREIHHKKHR
ncbi:hypothetical protein D7207_39140 [Burkholderia cepacia]|nr:hypothetical protein [Burkholderia cepacia]MBA9948968.1 hypothetical protein [Burkholderia cepacia]MBA9979239.1 hypothetical protein [Burkholderia cepacia]MBA9998018.1 hypothetical protein [Burkholderia cepacia]MBB0006114.1 hypothetical protein [Burkholderia cepacia]